MLTCPKCSFDNELGRIFCHQCGTKLDLDQIKPAARGGPKIRRRGGWTPAKIARTAAEWIVVVLIIWVLWLALSVPQENAARPTNAELIAADSKRLDLVQLVERNRAGTIDVSETELNAFLSSLSFDKPKGTGIEVAPLGLRATLGDGWVQIAFWGELRMEKLVHKKLYISCTAVPTVEDGEFTVQPVAAYIGKLPLHPVLLNGTDLIQRYFRTLFGKLGYEKGLLDKLSSITIKPQQAQLTRQVVTNDVSQAAAPAAH
jgi:hypothetical protein